MRALLVLALLSLAGTAEGQSLLDRPPNLAGTWTGSSGVLQFHLVHRFDLSSGEVQKVSSAPTFLVGGTPVDRLFLGFRYASNSQLVASLPNEWEASARFGVLEMDRGAPVDLSVTAAYNETAGSFDGEVSLARDLGPLRAMVVGRGFQDRAGTGEDAGSVALGAVVRPHRWLSLAGDVGWLVGSELEDELVWGGGLHVRIPSTPHTLSLQATNTNTATLQGSAHPGGQTRWGFEFTVPVTLARYFGGGSSARAEPPAVGGDTVRVEIRNLEFRPARIAVRPGTVVVWTNRDPVIHTATEDGGQWDSGEIEEGRSWSRVFETPGETTYHCTPHPFMQGVIEVREPEGAGP